MRWARNASAWGCSQSRRIGKTTHVLVSTRLEPFPFSRCLFTNREKFPTQVVPICRVSGYFNRDQVIEVPWCPETGKSSTCRWIARDTFKATRHKGSSQAHGTHLHTHGVGGHEPGNRPPRTHREHPTLRPRRTVPDLSPVAAHHLIQLRSQVVERSERFPRCHAVVTLGIEHLPLEARVPRSCTSNLTRQLQP